MGANQGFSPQHQMETVAVISIEIADNRTHATLTQRGVVVAYVVAPYPSSLPPIRDSSSSSVKFGSFFIIVPHNSNGTPT